MHRFSDVHTLTCIAVATFLVAAPSAAAQNDGPVSAEHVASRPVASAPQGSRTGELALQRVSESRPSPQIGESMRWYGGYTLLADGLAVGLTLLAFALDSEPATIAAVSAYLLGAPIVHAAHGQWGRSALSLGLRVGLPVGLLLVGAAIDDCGNQDLCGLGTFVIAGTTGTVAAVVLDASLLAWKAVPGAVQPAFAMRRGGAWVGARVVF